ncbi:30S ribosomal protein S20 [Synechococcus sp. PCC 6312]|uniref:30S ribosomal protein S20 n=1 Tax=Synechococcus sp. (strain ATCC 27167 / PCC 6312) TaxID=195253 RepID=UPI00029EF99F|nr:30S ribosomal protein S20 [Synechococcus sp. PCC 6312]AFY61441.1 ribosomal protein S20 [Synechococcus sp. PCC 6312]
MANIKSAIKRVEIAERNRLENKAYKSVVKTMTKHYLQAVQTYTSEPTPEALATAQAKMSVTFSKIDKAVKRGVIHRNTGARKKARLARVLNKVTAPA